MLSMVGRCCSNHDQPDYREGERWHDQLHLDRAEYRLHDHLRPHCYCVQAVLQVIIQKRMLMIWFWVQNQGCKWQQWGWWWLLNRGWRWQWWLWWWRCRLQTHLAKDGISGSRRGDHRHLCLCHPLGKNSILTPVSRHFETFALLQASSFPVLLAFVTVFGMSLGLFDTADNSLMVYIFGPIKSRPFTQSVHAFVGVGFVLGSVLVQVSRAQSARAPPHMGQFLQGGNFGCFTSFFLKVEPSCDQTW